MADEPRDDAGTIEEGERLTRALRDTPARELLTDPALHDAVRRFATAARGAGLPPERLVVQLKALVRSAAAPGAGSWYQTVVTDRVLVWAIEAYYDLPAGS